MLNKLLLNRGKVASLRCLLYSRGWGLCIQYKMHGVLISYAEQWWPVEDVKPGTDTNEDSACFV
jgi:hypothetical protein